MNIAVVGCGTAGPASALFLRRLGHSVSIFDKFATPSSIGAGLLVQPPALLVLHRLGLLPQTLQHGAKVTQLNAFIPSGRRVLHANYRNIHPELFGLGLHRGALHSILHSALCAAEIPQLFGTSIIGIEPVNTMNRTQSFLRAESGARHGPFDLVVVADGAKSSLRPPRACVKPYEWGGMWVIIKPDSDVYNEQYSGRLTQWYNGATKFMGILPTGASAPNHDADLDSRKGLVTLFWSIREQNMVESRRKGLNAWKDEVRSLNPDVGPVLEKIEDFDQLLLARYQDTRMFPYHEQNVVYLGDSCHSMNPALGNGCNLALMDAFVLSQCFSQTQIVSEALDAYSRLRKRHVRFYQWASRRINPLFQSSFPFAHWARDYIMGPSADLIPWLRSQQELSLVGIKTGFFTKLHPNPLEEYLEECASHLTLAVP